MDKMCEKIKLNLPKRFFKKPLNSDYQKFIILSSPRVGSSWLRSLLASHSEVVCFSEILRNEAVGGTGYGERNFKNDEFNNYRDENIVRFFCDVVFQKYHEKIRAVGLKMHCHQPQKNWMPLWSYFYGIPDFKVIYLNRRNHFREFVSLKRGLKTKVWAVLDDNNASLVRLSLNNLECERFFKKKEMFNVFMENILIKLDQHKLYYEDLFLDTDKNISKILNFLNLRDEKLYSSHKKINLFSLKETVVNYDDLKRYFSKTRWKHFFDE